MRSREKLALWAARGVLLGAATWLLLVGFLIPEPGFLAGSALLFAAFTASFRWPTVAPIGVAASLAFVLFAWTAPTWL